MQKCALFKTSFIENEGRYGRIGAILSAFLRDSGNQPDALCLYGRARLALDEVITGVWNIPGLKN
jgi:hypothetical protein